MTSGTAGSGTPAGGSPTPLTAAIGLVLGTAFAILGLLPHLLDGGHVLGPFPGLAAGVARPGVCLVPPTARG